LIASKTEFESTSSVLEYVAGGRHSGTRIQELPTKKEIREPRYIVLGIVCTLVVIAGPIP
jgi:hypothetical protein